MPDSELTIEPLFLFNDSEIPLKQTVVPVLFMVDMAIEIEERYPNLPKDFRGTMNMTQIINLN